MEHLTDALKAGLWQALLKEAWYVMHGSELRLHVIG